MSEPNRLLAAAEELQAFCTHAGWKFCFIGGIAVQHWGEARLTERADDVSKSGQEKVFTRNGESYVALTTADQTTRTRSP